MKIKCVHCRIYIPYKYTNIPHGIPIRYYYNIWVGCFLHFLQIHSFFVHTIRDLFIYLFFCKYHIKYNYFSFLLVHVCRIMSVLQNPLPPYKYIIFCGCFTRPLAIIMWCTIILHQYRSHRTLLPLFSVSLLFFIGVIIIFLTTISFIILSLQSIYTTHWLP